MDNFSWEGDGLYITIGGLLRFSASWFFLCGIWQFLYLRISLKGYEKKKQDGETFFDFCCRYYGGVDWKIRQKLGIKWFYNSRAYKLCWKLKGVGFLLVSVAFLSLHIWINHTDYAVWLDIRL